MRAGYLNDREKNRLLFDSENFYEYLLSPEQIPIFNQEFDKYAMEIDECVYILVDYGLALDKRRSNSSYLH